MERGTYCHLQDRFFIAISIGVLVDASVVMVENSMSHLHEKFGASKVRGDTREPRCGDRGPIFFSVMIMVVSFIPVFALGGTEGRIFHPLAYAKTFATVGVSILAVTLCRRSCQCPCAAGSAAKVIAGSCGG